MPLCSLRCVYVRTSLCVCACVRVCCGCVCVFLSGMPLSPHYFLMKKYWSYRPCVCFLIDIYYSGSSHTHTYTHTHTHTHTHAPSLLDGCLIASLRGAVCEPAGVWHAWQLWQLSRLSAPRGSVMGAFCTCPVSREKGTVYTSQLGPALASSRYLLRSFCPLLNY